MLLSRGIKLGASADYSPALILIQEGTGAICLALVFANIQSWKERQATGGDVPPALMCGGAHWGHRSETRAAPREENGDEATGEEFLQQG